ncbi:hypothetical protein POTOM_021598 [Populus tomentosa]|uniref:MraW methylase family protein n=1 Tax=Populus tomentosa TaxID=118781 RepID=A0A8X8CSN0_POPTO|nr:hypothetical protein POTOM_021598 [Populus tomentosa]
MAKRMMYCWLSTPLSTAKQPFNIKTAPSYSRPVLASARAERSISTASKKKKRKERNKSVEELVVVKNDKEKRRTRSEKEYEELHSFHQTESHVPVMLGEVVDVFSSLPLRSFIDCTLGAAGHSSAIIKGHPELECYIGMDVDPVAHAKARAHIDALLQSTRSSLKPHLLFKNFKYIKSVVGEIDDDCKLLSSGVDGILMDLGMSSMQVNNPQRGFSVLANGPLDMRMDPRASVKAKDILNYWPDDEVGRILREYGEESNWRWLQKKIVQARQQGGLHSTGELRDLIQGATHGTKGGRQGWIKTATRVFQALRIAVNDELNTLEKSLHACFECLVPGGRLAVISFHSLEDRIVKQTFLKIIESNGGDGDVVEEEAGKRDLRKMRNDIDAKETWIRQMVQGQNGTILTKRPITPSEEEERLNRREAAGEELRMMIPSGNKWKAAGREGLTTFTSFAFPYLTNSRKRKETVNVRRADMAVYNSKKANLTAARKERMNLPITDGGYRISEFLSHPFGIQAILNTGSLQSFQSLDANTYRCILPKVELLNFEAAPVLDLRVSPSDEHCTVEMISCKFQGSELVERQNDHFSAFMVNYMTWNTNISEPFLEVDVKLNLMLEIYTQPFTLLPTSAVESAGNL